MTVLDSSAVLAIVFGEAGAGRVEAKLDDRSLMSTVNVTEVLTRSLDEGWSFANAVTRFQTLPLTVVPFDVEMARLAAELREHTRQLGLSLADRACLALGLLRGGPIVTADRDWAQLDLGVEIEVIR